MKASVPATTRGFRGDGLQTLRTPKSGELTRDVRRADTGIGPVVCAKATLSGLSGFKRAKTLDTLPPIQGVSNRARRASPAGSPAAIGDRRANRSSRTSLPISSLPGRDLGAGLPTRRGSNPASIRTLSVRIGQASKPLRPWRDKDRPRSTTGRQHQPPVMNRVKSVQAGRKPAFSSAHGWGTVRKMNIPSPTDIFPKWAISGKCAQPGDDCKTFTVPGFAAFVRTNVLPSCRVGSLRQSFWIGVSNGCLRSEGQSSDRKKSSP